VIFFFFSRRSHVPPPAFRISASTRILFSPHPALYSIYGLCKSFSPFFSQNRFVRRDLPSHIQLPRIHPFVSLRARSLSSASWESQFISFLGFVGTLSEAFFPFLFTNVFPPPPRRFKLYFSFSSFQVRYSPFSMFFLIVSLIYIKFSSEEIFPPTLL